MKRLWTRLPLMLLITACSSSGTLGIVTRPMADAGVLLKSGRPYQELGSVEGQKCRYFVIAIVPWGDGDFAHAVEQALAKRGGDALLNVSVETSLYTFIPL